ncbi:hypothetical protein CYY_009935 [Polysphondylium violaceum]|uniref:Uncharacterized protein n=1 Tax=Polysphondylium violaceum TaxID=133409 RepID=A0A8J4PKB7_9MYCE|nr:hypothetical protein CYY_009935 [Polysphondylium violaceum]
MFRRVILTFRGCEEAVAMMRIVAPSMKLDDLSSVKDNEVVQSQGPLFISLSILQRTCTPEIPVLIFFGWAIRKSQNITPKSSGLIPNSCLYLETSSMSLNQYY